MNRRAIITIILSLVTALGIGGAITASTPAAHAQTFTQLVDNAGSHSLCWNRAGGKTANGTGVIGYSCGDPNNNFFEVQLVDMCGNGVVTDTCPFTVGSGLNDAWKGAAIIEIVAIGTNNKCVGGNEQLDYDASLQPCPDSHGNGGGWSTILIRDFSEVSGGRFFDFFINRNWSNWYVTHSNPQCHGFTCTLVDGLPGAKGARIVMQLGDAGIRGGNPAAANFYDQWAEV